MCVGVHDIRLIRLPISDLHRCAILGRRWLTTWQMMSSTVQQYMAAEAAEAAAAVRAAALVVRVRILYLLRLPLASQLLRQGRLQRRGLGSHLRNALHRLTSPVDSLFAGSSSRLLFSKGLPRISMRAVSLHRRCPDVAYSGLLLLPAALASRGYLHGPPRCTPAAQGSAPGAVSRAGIIVHLSFLTSA